MSIGSVLKSVFSRPDKLFVDATKVISFVLSVMDGVQLVKDAPGAEKKQRVLDELAARLADAEGYLGKDFAYDPAVAAAASAFIDAGVALKKALAASKAVPTVGQ